MKNILRRIIAGQTFLTRNLIPKQPPEVFCEKSVLRNFAKFTGKHLCQRFVFDKVAGLNTSGRLLLLIMFVSLLMIPLRYIGNFHDLHPQNIFSHYNYMKKKYGVKYYFGNTLFSSLSLTEVKTSTNTKIASKDNIFS